MVYKPFKNHMLKLPLFILALLALACNQRPKNTKQVAPGDTRETKKIIDSPLPALQVAYQNYRINPNADTVIIHVSGSQLHIPKNAFLDADGKVVKDPVVLRYREFSNAFEVYIAGIPMEIYADGKDQVFETAGMVDIDARAGGKALFVNPEQKISINQISFENGDYNIYDLDTLTGKWTETGKSKPQISTLKSDLEKLPKVPEPPKKAGRFAFEIEDAQEQQPELRKYKNVLFTPVNDKYAGFDATSIDVKDLGNGTYKITFNVDYLQHHREESVICYLAFKEGLDYDNALDSYRKKYAKQIRRMEKERRLVEKQWKNYEKEYKAYQKAGLKNFFENPASKLNEEEKIMRVLSVSDFGIINFDKPTMYPKAVNLNAKFTDEDGKTIHLKHIRLIEKGRNAIFNFSNSVSFDPTKENLLIGFTADQRLAYFKPDDFKKITQKNGDYTFKMRVNNGKITSYEELCRILF